MKKTEILLTVALFAADLISKYLAASKLLFGSSIKLIENFFYLTLVHNEGAAWGFFAGKLQLFYVATIATLGVIGYMLFHTEKENKAFRLPLCVVLAGTLGNFYDRIVFGYVRDFLDFKIFGYDFPVFNFADICLCCGVFFLILYLLLHPEDDDE